MEPTAEQKQEIREAYLAKFKCIDTDCDNNGTKPCQVGDNEWEATQCQYCFEVRFPTVDFILETLDQELTKREEETWDSHCKIFRSKIKSITDPVALNANNRSYDSLADTISNIILLEINIDKKPWEEIPKKEIRLPKREDMVRDSVWMDNPKTVAEVLLEKIQQEVSYLDMSADSYSPSTVVSLGLFSALKAFLAPQDR